MAPSQRSGGDMKLCFDCLIEKPYTEFHKSSASKDGHRRQCKSCNILRHKKWAASKGKEVISAWREANHEKLKDGWRRVYKDANRVKYFSAWRDANREAVRDVSNRYKRNNAGKVAARNSARAAGKITATPLWADAAETTQIYMDADEFRDAGLDVEVDHIVPLRSKLVCGLHVPANLRVILTTHNRAKSNRIWPDMP